MTISRRIALAFACMLLAFAVFATMGIVPTAVRFGPRYAFRPLRCTQSIYSLRFQVGFSLCLLLSTSRMQMAGEPGPSWPLESQLVLALCWPCRCSVLSSVLGGSVRQSGKEKVQSLLWHSLSDPLRPLSMSFYSGASQAKRSRPESEEIRSASSRCHKFR